MIFSENRYPFFRIMRCPSPRKHGLELSRDGNPCESRGRSEIITTSLAILGATLDMGMSEDMTPQQLFNPPPQGHRAVVVVGERKSGMLVVLRKHETRKALVAATVLWDRDAASEPLSAP